jgi:hypothetical protein
MEQKQWVPVAVLVAAFVLLALIVDKELSGAAVFDFDLTADDYTGLLVHVLIVTIIVERSLEVFNMIWRRPAREKLELEIEHETNKGKKQEMEHALKAYRGRTRTLAMYLGFAAGVVIAMAGVNVLGVLFDVTELPRVQAALFKSADIVITAGLIAGGSKALNETIKAIRDAVSTMRKGDDNQAV